MNQEGLFDSDILLDRRCVTSDDHDMLPSPPLLTGDQIDLEAVNPAANLFRFYSIEIALDLFGASVVNYRWGRIGTRGRQRSRDFSSLDAAQAFVGDLLSRRAGAVRRHGTSYRIV